MLGLFLKEPSFCFSFAGDGENDTPLRTGHQSPSPQPASLAWRFPSAQKAGNDGAGSRESMCEVLLQQALGKSELADVRFHVEGVWVVSGHRSVLSARSEVFAMMLANETEERRSGVIRLDDVTAEGLVAFLEFVYLGTTAATCRLLELPRQSSFEAARMKLSQHANDSCVCLCLCLPPFLCVCESE